MAAPLRLRSLAKINLDLRVLNKRPDGFHELRTIFQTISLADTIDVEYQPGRTRIEFKSNFNIPDNLIVRAADSVLKACSPNRPDWVRSAQSGSRWAAAWAADPATRPPCCWPCQLLLEKPLPIEKLMELAAELGSDVPFFLLGGTAVGLGRGTELYPLPDVPAQPASADYSGNPCLDRQKPTPRWTVNCQPARPPHTEN